MKLIQLFIPLYDNQGKAFSFTRHTALQKQLTDKFGGLTVYLRSPVRGLWKASKTVIKDDLVIYEVIAKNLEKKFWKELKKELESSLHQHELLIRCSDLQLL